MKKKRHGILWWLFIGFWWWPCRLICFDIPRLIIKSAIKPKTDKPSAPTPAPKPTPTPAPKPTSAPAPEGKIKTYKVTGMSHRIENIMALALKNDEYSLTKRELIDQGLEEQRVWEYVFYPTMAQLVPEPDNPHDQNAIKVVVDGFHVGYIKAGSCAHLLKCIKEGRIKKISVKMGGGRYKYLSLNGERLGEPVYELEKDEINYFVHLSIIEE